MGRFIKQSVQSNAIYTPQALKQDGGTVSWSAVIPSVQVNNG